MAAVELAKKVHVHTGAGSSVADADEVTYDGTAAGLAATDVQAAIDEVDGDLDAHLADAAAAHAGSAVSFSAAGLAVITGVTDVQAALAAVDAALDDRPTNAEASAAYAPAATVFARRTTANLNLTVSASFTTLSITTLAVPAAVDDIIAVDLNSIVGNEAASVYLDAATMVGGSPVTYFSTGTGTPANTGCRGWSGQGGAYAYPAGRAWIQVASGDLSGGTVTIQLYYRCSAGTGKTLYSNSDNPFIWGVQNLGKA